MQIDPKKKEHIEHLKNELLLTMSSAMSPRELYPQEDDREIISINIEVGSRCADLIKKFVLCYGRPGQLELFMDRFIGFIFVEGLEARIQKFQGKEQDDFLEKLMDEDPAAVEKVSEIALETATRNGKFDELTKEIREVLEELKKLRGEDDND